MFTGIVQAVGSIDSITPSPAGQRLIVRPNNWPHRPALGESIAVSGCCLTLADRLADARLAFDVIPQTLSLTTLGGLVPGSIVNLEPAVTAATLMSGHLVQGHVDGVGRVERVDRQDGWRVRIRPPTPLMEFIIPQGSIAVEGVSLTVAAVDLGAGAEPPWFEVALIPTTLALTNLGALSAGSACNLEVDAIAKTVIHWMRNYAGRS